jgi:hypothetical protein
MRRWTEYFEYLGGSRDDAPEGLPAVWKNPIALGMWWAVLLLAILMFCGQTSKFIYIDF